MATDRANYTPEELHKAKAVLAALPYRTVRAGDAARAVLDAVLPGHDERIIPNAYNAGWRAGQADPGYTQRIQVETLRDAADDYDGLWPSVRTWLQDRAAALAAPVEPAMATVEEGFAEWAPPVEQPPTQPRTCHCEVTEHAPDCPSWGLEQPPTQEIIETDRWGL